MTEQEWLDPHEMQELEQEFENFWLDIIEYADEIGVPVSYVEDEFVVLGELIKPQQDTAPVIEEFLKRKGECNEM